MRKTFLLSLLTVSATVLVARADIIPALSSISPAGSAFTWNYASNVTVDQTVQSGDFFTIYDFGAFNAGSNLQPASWTFSSSLVGTNPNLVTPTDNPGTLNLTWTYTGATPINGSAPLGAFSIVTSTDQLKTSTFAAQATLSTGPQAGSKVANIGEVTVPVPEMSALLPIIGVCAAGLIAALPSFLRRRKTV